MPRCAKPGARHRFLAIAFLILAVVQIDSAAADEFGNVFGQQATNNAPDASKQARTASAQALGALSAIFDGLRLRELQESSAPGALTAAVQKLSDASAAMKLVKTEELQKIPVDLSKINERDANMVRFAFSSIDQKLPEDQTNVQQLYATLILLTDRLASILIEQMNKEGPLLPAISNTLLDYIDYGATVSRIAHSVQ